jgi:hypothetical protein
MPPTSTLVAYIPKPEPAWDPHTPTPKSPVPLFSPRTADERLPGFWLATVPLTAATKPAVLLEDTSSVSEPLLEVRMVALDPASFAVPNLIVPVVAPADDAVASDAPAAPTAAAPASLRI